MAAADLLLRHSLAPQPLKCTTDLSRQGASLSDDRGRIYLYRSRQTQPSVRSATLQASRCASCSSVPSFAVPLASNQRSLLGASLPKHRKTFISRVHKAYTNPLGDSMPVLGTHNVYAIIFPKRSHSTYANRSLLSFLCNERSDQDHLPPKLKSAFLQI
jgi:hypothetical protein